MEASKFGRSNNGNAAPNIEDRYDTTKPTLNLLSTSRNRTHRENEPTNKQSAFSLQLANLKLPKRLDKNNPIPELGEHAYPFFAKSRWRICILGASSPFTMSQGSDDRAYIHSNHQGTVSPNPLASFRLSALKRPVTQESSSRAGPGYSTPAIQHFDEALLVSNFAMWAFCEPTKKIIQNE